MMNAYKLILFVLVLFLSGCPPRSLQLVNKNGEKTFTVFKIDDEIEIILETAELMARGDLEVRYLISNKSKKAVRYYLGDHLITLLKSGLSYDISNISSYTRTIKSFGNTEQSSDDWYHRYYPDGPKKFKEFEFKVEPGQKLLTGLTISVTAFRDLSKKEIKKRLNEEVIKLNLGTVKIDDQKMRISEFKLYWDRSPKVNKSE